MEKDLDLFFFFLSGSVGVFVRVEEKKVVDGKIYDRDMALQMTNKDWSCPLAVRDVYVACLALCCAFFAVKMVILKTEDDDSEHPSRCHVDADLM